jgi:farnesyl-diphosphate farnesyltransferase
VFWPQVRVEEVHKLDDIGCFAIQDKEESRALHCLNEIVTDALQLVTDCLENLFVQVAVCGTFLILCNSSEVMAIATLTISAIMVNTWACLPESFIKIYFTDGSGWCH